MEKIITERTRKKHCNLDFFPNVYPVEVNVSHFESGLLYMFLSVLSLVKLQLFCCSLQCQSHQCLNKASLPPTYTLPSIPLQLK